ncbi:hypothetical protein ID867_21305 [Streptomyces parvulus]|nr:hypothetical protein [Streptomyces parvulus]
MLRPLFRRDLALGYGFGITSLFAASSVWTAGDTHQRAALADVLLGGGRVAIVHREVAHANAILRREVRAQRPAGGGFLLNGSKDAVMNADRTDTFVVYARTSAGSGSASHSVLLLPGPPASGEVRRLARVEMPGMRGARFHGLRLADVRLPDSALVGSLGEGVTLALRSFQISHCLIPGTVLAGVDSVLRLAVRAATRTGPTDGPPAAGTRHSAGSSRTCSPATPWPSRDCGRSASYPSTPICSRRRSNTPCRTCCARTWKNSPPCSAPAATTAARCTAASRNSPATCPWPDSATRERPSARRCSYPSCRPWHARHGSGPPNRAPHCSCRARRCHRSTTAG